jgi:TolA-binding protein
VPEAHLRYASSSKKPLITFLANNPELIYSYQYNLELGRTYLNQKDYQKAHKHFIQAFNLAETNFDKSLTLYYSGRIFLFEQKPELAVKYLSKVLDYNRNPGKNFLYHYGVALSLSGRNEDALSTLSNLFLQLKMDSLQRRGFSFNPERLEKWSGNRNELLVLLGLVSLQTGKVQPAKKYLKMIPEKIRAEILPEANYLLAVIHNQDREFNEAESIIARTIKTFPEYLQRKSNLLLGMIQLEQGNHSMALITFETMARDTIQFLKDEAYLRAGFVNYRKRKFDYAVQFFQKLNDNFPNSALNEYGLFYLVQTYLKLNRSRPAVEKNQELTTKFPKSKFLERTIFDIAQILYQNQSYIQALREFKNYLKLFPKGENAEFAMFYAGLSAYRISDEPAAIELFQQLVTDYPNSQHANEAYYRIGSYYLSKHDYNLAMHYFMCLKHDRDKPPESGLPTREGSIRQALYPFGLKGIGDAYFCLAEYDKALRYYRRAERMLKQSQELPPESGLFDEGSIRQADTLLGDIHYAVEQVNWRKGRYTSYIDMLNKYLEKYPRSYQAAKLQMEIGLYYFERKDFNQAVNQFYRVFNYYPDAKLSAKTFLYIGRCQMLVKSTLREDPTREAYLSSATGTFQHIITNYTDTVSKIGAYMNLAEIYTKNLAYDKAIKSYLELIENYPKAKEAENSLISIAEIYQKLHKPLEAKTMLDRLIKEFPESDLLNQAYLQMIDILIKEGNLKYAETIANSFLKKFGANPAIDLRLGKIREEQNRYKDAKNLFLSAAKKSKKNEKAEALIFAANATIKLKEYHNAKELLNQALRVAEDERLRIKCRELIQKLKSY